MKKYEFDVTMYVHDITATFTNNILVTGEGGVDSFSMDGQTQTSIQGPFCYGLHSVVETSDGALYVSDYYHDQVTYLYKTF